MANWFYILDGREQGPISEEDLNHVFACGALPGTTPIWRAGMEDWCMALKCYDFEQHFRSELPPLTEVATPTSVNLKPNQQRMLGRRATTVLGLLLVAFCVFMAFGWFGNLTRVATQAHQASPNTLQGPHIDGLLQKAQQGKSPPERRVPGEFWRIDSAFGLKLGAVGDKRKFTAGSQPNEFGFTPARCEACQFARGGVPLKIESTFQVLLTPRSSQVAEITFKAENLDYSDAHLIANQLVQIAQQTYSGLEYKRDVLNFKILRSSPEGKCIVHSWTETHGGSERIVDIIACDEDLGDGLWNCTVSYECKDIDLFRQSN